MCTAQRPTGKTDTIIREGKTYVEGQKTILYAHYTLPSPVKTLPSVAIQSPTSNVTSHAFTHSPKSPIAPALFSFQSVTAVCIFAHSLHSHNGLDGDLRRHVVAHGVLLDLQGRQTECRVVLHLGGEPIVQHVVTALKHTAKTRRYITETHGQNTSLQH